VWELSYTQGAWNFGEEVEKLLERKVIYFFKEWNHKGLCKCVSFARTK